MCSSEQTKKTSTGMRVRWPTSSPWADSVTHTHTHTHTHIHTHLCPLAEEEQRAGGHGHHRESVLHCDHQNQRNHRSFVEKQHGVNPKRGTLKISDSKLSVNFWGSGERLLLCSLRHIWFIGALRGLTSSGNQLLSCSPLQGQRD